MVTKAKVTKMSVVAVLYFYVVVNSGVGGHPISLEHGDEVQPKRNETHHLQRSPDMKMIHVLLQRWEYFPDQRPDPQLDFQSNSTEESNAFALNSTKYPNDTLNELTAEYHETSQRLGAILHNMLMLADNIYQRHITPEINVHSDRSPVSFEWSDEGIAIHLNTQIDLGDAEERIIMNNNVTFLVRREEIEPEKEEPEPAESEQDDPEPEEPEKYDPKPEESDDNHYVNRDNGEDDEENEEGDFGNDPASTVMNDEKGSELR